MRLPKHGVGVEIGVWKGDFSAKLLRLARPSCLHLVDPWMFRSDPNVERVMVSQTHMDAIHDQVVRRFARQIRRGRIVVHRGRSAEVASELGPLDWVYIDGNHTYEGVKNDLAAYYPALKPGGVLAGDDYGLRGWWGDGVREAVDEFVTAESIDLSLHGNQYLMRKPS